MKTIEIAVDPSLHISPEEEAKARCRIARYGTLEGNIWIPHPRLSEEEAIKKCLREGSIVVSVEETLQMKTYRIMHRPTKQWWEGKARTPEEACKKAGWQASDCWVREYSPKGSGGWRKPKP